MNGIQYVFTIGMNTKNGNTIKNGVMRWCLSVMTAPMSINNK